MCSTYATGITDSIKRGVTFFFVPDDLFTIGNSVLQSMIQYNPQRKPNGAEEMTNSQNNFFEQQNLSLTKINERVSLAQWRAMADLVSVFQHDQTIKEELIAVTNKQIANKCCDFLDAVTMDFNDTIFRVLKLCYLPGVTMSLQAPDLDVQVKLDCLENF